MDDVSDKDWLDSIVQMHDGYEADAVNRFAHRLVRLAQSRLPDQLQRRVDPEDIVQSVFRSFFTRHVGEKFEFQEVEDIWRLLAAITYRKVQRTIRFHHQQKRDIRYENPVDDPDSSPEDDSPTSSALLVMMELLDGILAQIPERHQQILRMRLDGYPTDEISEKLSVSTRTVDRSLALVRKLAAETMNAHDD